MRYVVATRSTDLNVRSGPGLNFSVLRKLGRGAVVEVLRAQGVWRQLKDGGWVHGDYLRPEGSPATPRGGSRGAKRIVVDLASQTLTAYEGETQVYQFICVTGDAAHPTNPGHFRIFRKVHPYTSRTYGVPMNYALFFTADGKAIHQYHGILPLGILRSIRQNPGGSAVGSHGCVRLTQTDAEALYAWAPLQTPVIVR